MLCITARVIAGMQAFLFSSASAGSFETLLETVERGACGSESGVLTAQPVGRLKSSKKIGSGCRHRERPNGCVIFTSKRSHFKLWFGWKNNGVYGCICRQHHWHLKVCYDWDRPGNCRRWGGHRAGKYHLYPSPLGLQNYALRWRRSLRVGCAVGPEPVFYGI